MKFSKFFSNLQEAPWYRTFLNPVNDEIEVKGKLLDIGTGSGKLIQILVNEYGIECTGVDTNSDMLAEAKVKLANVEAKLIEINPDTKLPFEENSFDYITICSVLFHLKKESIDGMLNDALSLLKKDGKIIIQTPTGKGNLLKLTSKFFSIENKGIYIWYRSTKNRAKQWTKNNYLSEYALNNKLKYTRKFVMSEFAQIEIIRQ